MFINENWFENVVWNGIKNGFSNGLLPVGTQILQETSQPSIIKIHLEFTYPKLHLNSPMTYELTHCGLVTPYGERDLGQHWLR